MEADSGFGSSQKSIFQNQNRTDPRLFSAGFQFQPQMNGVGGGGGSFFTGSFTGFTGGGGAQMSGSTPQQQSGGQTGSPLQRQLLHIGKKNRVRRCFVSLFAVDVYRCVVVSQPPPSAAECLRAPGRPPPPCCNTAAPGTPASSSPSRDTCVASRTPTETRESALRYQNQSSAASGE